MKKFDGYLFSKLSKIGSKSEGPTYYLQQFDYAEVVVIKQANLWEEDPVLHPFIARKVTVEGELHSDGISYQQVAGYVPNSGVGNVEHRLLVELKLDDDTLWLNKMPGDSAHGQSMNLTLSVTWPFRSIWRGQCPTSQQHDFWIEFAGKTLWRWSDDRVFTEVITPVSIPGGAPHEFTEVWPINPDSITTEGIYTAKALHIASGAQVLTTFKIRFAQ